MRKENSILGHSVRTGGSSMGLRRRAREAALQALFMCDSLDTWSADDAIFCLDHFGIQSDVQEYARTLCIGIVEFISQVDSSIAAASEHWSLARMARVDRCILRLATFEILGVEDVPTNVSIDEAIEIAKRFGSETSPVFVNGVLDHIASNPKLKIEFEKAVENHPSDGLVTDGSLALAVNK